jgi:hypothetical protein
MKPALYFGVAFGLVVAAPILGGSGALSATVAQSVTLICDLPPAYAPGTQFQGFHGSLTIFEGHQEGLVQFAPWHVTPTEYLATFDWAAAGHPNMITSIEIDRSDGTAIYRDGRLDSIAESRGQCKKFDKPAL